jgi:hypothetical protein
MFHHCNIHKLIWTSPDGKMHNQCHHILRDKKDCIEVYLMSDLLEKLTVIPLSCGYDSQRETVSK